MTLWKSMFVYILSKSAETEVKLGAKETIDIKVGEKVPLLLVETLASFFSLIKKEWQQEPCRKASHLIS